MRALLIACLGILGLSVSPIRNTFVGDSRHHSSRPYYSLGTLSKYDSISVQVSFPEPSGIAPSNFTVQLYDSTHKAASYQPGNFGQVLKIPQKVGPAVKWKGTIAQPGKYYVLFRTGQSPLSSLQTMEIEIAVNGVRVWKGVDVLRGAESYRVFYLERERKVMITNTGGWTVFHPLKASNRMVIDSASRIYATFVNPILPRGYYLLRLSSIFQGRGAQTVTYESDPFPCPHSSLFPDPNHIFAPCQHPPSNSSEAENLTCGQRQFKSNHTCLPVNQNCQTFNPQADECYSCKNSSHDLSGGKCTPPSPKPTICPSGTSRKGENCVPNTCTGVDSSGRCTGCISSQYQLDSAGGCSKKTCPHGQTLNLANNECLALCWANQQKIRNMCYNVPTGCKMLAPHLACQECLPGYSFNFGVCEPSRLLRQQQR